MTKKNELARNEDGLVISARVAESMVLRGDISALTAEERTRFYVQMCESLGLNPTSQPFAMLRLQGKEILYPTRGATDQLAAIHRITREIVDGPRLIDLGGTKLVYALCRATHPNGRVETASATVPFQDPVNVLMKAETKAKRRATLSILGLGMLDESEIETIPHHVKSAAAPIAVPGAETPVEHYEPERMDASSSSEPAASAGGTELRVDTSTGDPPSQAEAVEPPAVVATFLQSVAEIELPGEAVGLWIKYRPELATLSRDEREPLWKALCKRTEEIGGMKNAKVWLKKAIAVEDARRGKPEQDMSA